MNSSLEDGASTSKHYHPAFMDPNGKDKDAMHLPLAEHDNGSLAAVLPYKSLLNGTQFFNADLQPSNDVLHQMAPTSLLCTDETLMVGVCNGMPVCGFCYDFGQFHKPSREYEIYNLAVIGVILPTIGVMGLLGNSVSAFVYSRRRMQSSLNLYLCALAFSDIIIVSTSFFLFFLESLRKRSAFISKYYALLAPIMFPLGLTAQSLSVFLTIAAAIDCFVLMTGAERVRKRCCTVRTSKLTICFVVLLAMCFNLPHLFEVTVINCWSVPYRMPSYDVCPTALRQNEAYYTVYYAYLYTIVMAAGPVFLLIVLNSIIIYSMRKKSKRALSGEENTNHHLSDTHSIKNNAGSGAGTGLSGCNRPNGRDFLSSLKGSELTKFATNLNGGGINTDGVATTPASTTTTVVTIINPTSRSDSRESYDEPPPPPLPVTNISPKLSRINGKVSDLAAASPASNHRRLSLVQMQQRLPLTLDEPSADVTTLVLVVCLFISCNVLPLTVNFLELIFNLVNSYLIDLSNLMVVVNSSCNFLIYYAFGEEFRETLNDHLHAVRRKAGNCWLNFCCLGGCGEGPLGNPSKKRKKPSSMKNRRLVAMTSTTSHYRYRRSRSGRSGKRRCLCDEDDDDHRDRPIESTNEKTGNIEPRKQVTDDDEVVWKINIATDGVEPYHCLCCENESRSSEETCHDSGCTCRQRLIQFRQLPPVCRMPLGHSQNGTSAVANVRVSAEMRAKINSIQFSGTPAIVEINV